MSGFILQIDRDRQRDRERQIDRKKEREKEREREREKKKKKKKADMNFQKGNPSDAMLPAEKEKNNWCFLSGDCSFMFWSF